MKFAEYQDVKLKNQIAPLIDVVFLLLIYFMVTATLIKKEGDISFSIPVSGAPMTDWPVEAYIQIANDGAVTLEGMHFDSSDRELRDLVGQIASLKQLADSQQTDFIVTLAPSDDTMHGRVIDVMDACRDAKVRHLAFAHKNT